MNILVNATALNERGAFSLVKSLLVEINKSQDFFIKSKLKLEFLVSRKELCEYENESVKVRFDDRYKKSFLEKWKFQNRFLPNYLKK